MKKLIVLLATFVFLSLAGALVINLSIIYMAKPYIVSSLEELPESYTVIIPGAKVYETTVSHVVHDRIDCALNVLNAEKAKKILVSGDHGRKDYDEVNAIKDFMVKNYGTDESVVFLDHAGFSTYETMYRARAIFNVSECTVVSQAAFIHRAVYIARKLGLNAVGITAPALHPYAAATQRMWKVREFLARIKAFFDVLFRVKPTYLGEQIPITGDASLSWD